MKATIVESVIGILGYDEENILKEWILYPKDPKIVARKIMELNDGKPIDEIVTLIERMKRKGFDTFIFEKPEISKAIHELMGVKVKVETPSGAGEFYRSNVEKVVLSLRFFDVKDKVKEWTHKVCMEISRIRVRKAIERRDLLIVQVINAIDDIEKTLNLFMGRLREWYSLHFPELNRLLDRHETYARLVNDLRERKNFTFEKLLEEGLPKTKALRVFVAAQASMGTDLSETDIKLLTEFSEYILELYRLRDSLDQYLDDLMSNVAPNIHAITGATLGARLISLAGGLDNLAKMPASTIQVLGAEKALFRALKTGSRPPKHGVIFQHHFIHEAKRWQRGKIARLLAGKIAIAARIDAYSGKYIGDSLQRDLEKRLSEIKEKYQKPKIKEQKARRSQRRKKSVRGGRKHERKS